MCPDGFTGERCSYAEERIDTTAETNGTVPVEVRVTNRVFEEAFHDNTSHQYQTFVEDFKKQMDKVYENVEGYRGIQVLQLRNGSVIVDHVVLVALQVTADSQQRLQSIAHSVQREIQGAASGNCSDGLCFSDANVGNSSYEFNGTAFCQSVVPPAFASFYFPAVSSSGVSCVTNCTEGAAGSIDCHWGRCRVTTGGPTCLCQEPELYWYTGDRCASRVSKLAVGLGSAVAVLGSAIIVLLIFMVWARRTNRTTYGVELKERWYENAEERWSPTWEYGVWNEDAPPLEDSLHVDLQTVDTSAPVHIQRPQRTEL